ncbi:response regulator transcription factor [Halanaerobium kushneri]|uniref:Stage 0 sporulation protein A homolog n=1 Tax=Halanaerobium kushneri TaxID=56779 RepID=A0A1N6RXA1_9FIRM|nr:response regulator [Halanaerobium kushneri]SIQ33448.1 two-component system, response regulator YesN [Halanaerobium kushneri]
MLKVIIIDDEPWAREVIKSLGRWEKYKLDIVGEAVDGQNGLQLIKKERPDIVITDMRMPALDGPELLKTIAEKFPEIKIIVMSGYDDFEYMQQAIRSQAVEYLLKPINGEELNSSLEKCARILSKKAELFSKAKEQEKYSAYRQRINEYLLSLDKGSILRTFKQLGSFMEKSSPALKKEKGLLLVFNDFKLILDEFLKKEGAAFSEEAIIPAEITALAWIKLFEILSNLYSEGIDTVEDSIKNSGQLEIEEVKAHINSHFQDPISLETLAQHFFVSKEHLSRKFKSYSGENISSYIIRKRMEKAKQLLKEGKLSIKETAQVTGYNDLAYFYRVFKKYYGKTPGSICDE